MGQKWICINCAKPISMDDFNCPYCGYQQYLDGFGKPVKVKIKPSKKKKSVFSTAEVYTALNKSDDAGYLAFLATKLFGG